MTDRILFVTQQLPWPKDSGGNIRTYFMLAGLAKRFDVVLCSTSDGSPAAQEGERVLSEMCAEVHLVPDEKQHSTFGKVLAVLRSFLRGQSAVLTHNKNEALGSAVQAALATGRIDRVHLNHLDTTVYVDLANCPPVVVDTHNLLFDYYARRAEFESSKLAALTWRREAKLLREVELRVFRAAERAVVCSEVERQRLLEQDASLRVDVVPNGVDCAAVVPARAQDATSSRELVFVGDLAYGPNQDAAMRFIEDVLPLVQEREPRAVFLAVGKNPPMELAQHGRLRDDVIVTGFVDDVADWINRAELYVVPIRYGSGTRLKVLEAFAFAKPTISTFIGAEGIDYTEGQDILIRDEPRAMADAILELFADPERAANMARAARTKAQDLYDWPQLGERMAELHGAH